MDNEKKAQLLEQGFTEAEADFLIKEYGDMDLSPEDSTVYADRNDYFEAQLELVSDMGADTASEPLSYMLEAVDVDKFIDKVRDLGINWELVDLPSGRFAEIYY